MAVHISRVEWETIRARAVEGPGREICGLLLGQGGRIVEAREAANVADEPASRFEIDPAVLLAAHRESRSGGPAILGHYHSHPGGDVSPSACDADMASPDGALWLICAPDGRMALWRAGHNGLHGRFVAVELTVEDA